MHVVADTEQPALAATERLLDLVRRVRERNLPLPEKERHYFEKFQL